MALAHFQRTFTGPNGVIQPGLSVTIRNEATGALAAIYTDKEGQTSAGNPLKTDATGYLSFYARPGRYRITATDIDWRDEDLVTHEALDEAVDLATMAADAASLNAGVFASTNEGLAATDEGGHFSVPSAEDGGYLTLYRNESGAAIEVDTYPNKRAVDDAVAEVNSALGDRVLYVDSIADLQALNTAALKDGQVIYLSQQGREGEFQFRLGDYSSLASLDAFNGIYISLPDDPEAASKVFERKIDKEIRLSWFGTVDGGNINDEYASARALCLQLKKDLYIAPGSYEGWGLELIPGQQVVGAGSQLVEIDALSNGGVFASPAITETTITQSTDLLSGEIAHDIANTAQAGDFIRFKSTRRFTEEWDGGTEIRPSYVDGELLSVYSATGSGLVFDSAPVLNFPLATSDTVSTFTPHKKGGIFGVKVRRTRDTTTHGTGIYVDGFNGFEYDDIETENFNTAGIGIYRSMHISAGTLVARGGAADLGLDYGLAINDGTKYLTAKAVYGYRCRHAVAGGGTGYAIPMFAKVGYISASGSHSHGADAHANTAHFTYDRVDADTGVSMSGIGHHVGTAVCRGGKLYLAYEGGVDLTFDNIVGRNIEQISPDKAAHRVTIGCYDVETSGSLGAGALFKSGSSEIRINQFRLVNPFVGAATSTAEANAVSSSQWLYGLLMEWPDSHINYAYVEGFPVGAYVTAERCSIERLELVNCAWSNALTSICAALLVSKSAEGSAVGSGNIRAMNPNIGGTSSGKFIGRVVQFSANGYGSGKSIAITNVNTEGSAVDYYYGASIPADFTNLFLQNNHLGPGGSSVSATGKFVYNSFVADN